MSIFGQLFGGGQPATLPEGAILVDVRSPMEFNMGHVQGSINIPLDTVQQELDRFRAMNGPIVLICASGNRSGQATSFLQRQGLQNVRNGGSWMNFR